ncbi:MAG: transposase [Polyangiaceae bacterium]|nr:transposase [Polyangiaceae bacterium]
MNSDIGLSAEQRRLSMLSELGDPLEKLAAAVDFELFRPLLNEIFSNPDRPDISDRPSWDYVLMFKILILCRLYNIADNNTEYLIKDSLSFQRFLGLTLRSPVPDSKTIWLYKDQFLQSGKSKVLFNMFTDVLLSKGIVSLVGSSMDASFSDAAPTKPSTGTRGYCEPAIPKEWLAQDHRACASLRRSKLTRVGRKRMT